MKNKFKDYLIVSDLDGTFFGESPRLLLQKNLDAIRYFESKGGIFTIATGRDYRTMAFIFPDAKDYLSGPAILCNGAYLYDFQNNTVMDEISIDKAEFFQLYDKISKEFPNVGFRISTHKGYLAPVTTPFLLEKSKSYLSLMITDPLTSNLDTPWHKCVFVAPPETIDKMRSYLQAFEFETLNVITSHQTLLEILPKASGKGAKLMELKKFYPGRKAICVGDYDNDLDMLKAADIAACPENAIAGVKDIATIHLCHHRDGCIADLIYKLDSSSKE